MYPKRNLLIFAVIVFFIGASVLACANPLYETAEQPTDQPGDQLPPENLPQSTTQPQSAGDVVLQPTATRSIDYDDVDREEDPGCVYIDKDGNVINPCLREEGTQEPTETPWVYDFDQCNEAKKEVKIDLSVEYECSTCDWKFALTNLLNDKCYPESITITWENGDIRRIPINHVEENIAYYYTSRNIYSLVEDVSVETYESWAGDFYIAYGGCAVRCVPYTPTPTP